MPLAPRELQPHGCPWRPGGTIQVGPNHGDCGQKQKTVNKETLQHWILHDLGISWTFTCAYEARPKWSWEAPTAPEHICGGARFLPQMELNKTKDHYVQIESTHLKTSKFAKTHTNKPWDWSGCNPLNSSGVPFGDESYSGYPWSKDQGYPEQWCGYDVWRSRSTNSIKCCRREHLRMTIPTIPVNGNPCSTCFASSLNNSYSIPFSFCHSLYSALLSWIPALLRLASCVKKYYLPSTDKQRLSEILKLKKGVWE